MKINHFSQSCWQSVDFLLMWLCYWWPYLPWSCFYLTLDYAHFKSGNTKIFNSKREKNMQMLKFHYPDTKYANQKCPETKRPTLKLKRAQEMGHQNCHLIVWKVGWNTLLFCRVHLKSKLAELSISFMKMRMKLWQARSFGLTVQEMYPKIARYHHDFSNKDWCIHRCRFSK